MDEQATVDTDATAAAEAEARVFGWKPRDEFAGDPADWRPADAFLKRGKEINGFLRKDLNTLKAEIAKRDASLAELQQTMAQFAAFHQETENRAYAKARKDLQAARRQALRENDGDTVAEIEERLDELDEAKPQPRQAPPTRNPEAPDPVLVAWSEANTWYRDNAKLRRIADGYGMQLRQSEPNLVGQAFLDKLTAQVREDFPEHFERGGTGWCSGCRRNRHHRSQHGTENLR